ncbi:hypothetical protein PQO01_16835 [Lentisphaera marina]|uniref:hypothetical protein n=1 Tax=Lentisphaera marina TaxID=1111041 RepID=UPI00236728A2|nr:hypothetical protein [Lentisphaera marina]MDD7986619.1 hypothetical protein [Lentisphaera marina]
MSPKVLGSDMGELISECSDLFEIEIETVDDPYFAIVPNLRYNCLDHDNSRVRYFPGSKDIAQIYDFAFHTERIGNNFLFKYHFGGNQTLSVYDPEDEDFDQSFYYLYKKNNFTGLRFMELWDSEIGPVKKDWVTTI